VVGVVVLKATNVGIDAVKEEEGRVEANAEVVVLSQGVAWGAPAEGLNEAATTSNPAASLNVQELMFEYGVLPSYVT
jgi:hypothetical protein